MITYDSPWLNAGDKLICFGDSLTADRNGYVRILQEKLAAQQVTVVNAGRGGDKTPWALTRLEPDIIAKKPQAISIFLGTNDCVVGRGRWADEPTVPSEVYKSNLIWIVHLCRLTGIQKFSITPPLCRFEGEAWLEHGDIMAPYRLAAREAADEMKARFVPADSVFADEWSRHPGHTGLLLTRDGTHLTKKSNELLAEAMLKAWRMAL